jgi:Zn finger protein HypA/HybF involved in hydrogenase expression
MYYESRIHKKRPVKDVAEAAAIIKSGKFYSYEALIVDDRYAFVDDSSIHGTGVSEIAVIDIVEDKQLESITAGWIDDVNELEYYFRKAIEGDFVIRSGANLSFSKEDINKNKVAFECGCCASYFKDYHKNQVKYDQDQGFGICPNCQHLY